MSRGSLRSSKAVTAADLAICVGCVNTARLGAMAVSWVASKATLRRFRIKREVRTGGCEIR